jgi:hypothetical protein
MHIKLKVDQVKHWTSPDINAVNMSNMGAPGASRKVDALLPGAF